MSITKWKEIAVKNNEYRKEHFKEEIEDSVRNVQIFDDQDYRYCSLWEPRYNEMHSNIYGVDIKQYLHVKLGFLTGKTAVLNFASYKNPGGGYMSGMMAQEEALCHCTTLYEVLETQEGYYERNNENKNKGMYKNVLMYVPRVLVLDNEQKIVGKVDVITCAAPNMSVGLKYKSFSVEQCQEVFKDRIKFLMHVAAYKQVDNFILGAWGCGVFKNDPEFVAKSLFETAEEYRGHFKQIDYVIPKGDNLYTFLRVGADLE